MTFGYVLKKGEENISRSDIANTYSRILKEIEPRMKNNSFHIGWFNPNPFSRYQRFIGLDKRKILKMYQNRDLLEDLVKRIKAEEIVITNEFKRRIEM